MEGLEMKSNFLRVMKSKLGTSIVVSMLTGLVIWYIIYLLK